MIMLWAFFPSASRINSWLNWDWWLGHYKCTGKFLVFLQVILRKILFLSPGAPRSCYDVIIFGVIASRIGHMEIALPLLKYQWALPSHPNPHSNQQLQQQKSVQYTELNGSAGLNDAKAMLKFPQISLIGSICTSGYSVNTI